MKYLRTSRTTAPGHLVRGTTGVILHGSWAFGAWAFDGRSLRVDGRRVVTDRSRGWLLVVAQFVLLGAHIVAPTGAAWALPDSVRLLGTVGRIAGGALIVIGAVRLGLAASVHPAPTTSSVLRTDGAYRYARHPIYTGVLVVGAAMALTGRSVLHTAAWGALLGVLTIKARFEERLLTERFPNYPSYAATTRRFVPIPFRRPRRR